MAFFQAFKAWTIRYLPWQAPYPSPLKGPTEPRRGLYAAFFRHIWRESPSFRGESGYLSHTIGDSNRPTMTGMNELIYTSRRYRGGREVQIGDLISIRVIEKSRNGKNHANYTKRIVGLPGHQRYKKGRQAWYQISVAKCEFSWSLRSS